MKATGIVRRIDDLGRVVVPKEIRRTLRIREGDPLEIFTDKEGEIILKKYSPMGELGAFVGELCEAMNKTSKLSCAICDRDTVIAAAGNAKKDIYEMPISKDLKSVMEQRQKFDRASSKSTVCVCEDSQLEVTIVCPIITEGDVSGCVAFLTDGEEKKVDEGDMKLAQTVALFLSGQLEA